MSYENYDKSSRIAWHKWASSQYPLRFGYNHHCQSCNIEDKRTYRGGIGLERHCIKRQYEKINNCAILCYKCHMLNHRFIIGQYPTTKTFEMITYNYKPNGEKLYA